MTFRSDLPPYEDYNGPVDTPAKYVDFCSYQGRQTGKTHKLLMSIPNRKIYIVVHKQQMGREMVSALKQIRPDYNVDNIKFISYDPHGKYLEIMRGNSWPVYVDNCVLDIIQDNYVRSLNFGRA